MRFYEIHAKSALNRVPKASRMPFRWTINPYRGCSHACVYCVHGDTPVLLGDGRHCPIKDLRVGDAIYGTERRGRYRRYVKTRVLAHWVSVKPAYRVTLEDATELISSGDHRFLTERGWKHVTDSACGTQQRPHLTTGNSLLGTGRFSAEPEHSSDYERGYLCGIVRGDGNLASSSYDRPGRRSPSTVHRFRLALVDDEALQRAESYLLSHGVETTRFMFSAGSATQRPAQAIRTQARARCELIRELVSWPLDPTAGWRKGFLAGIFDAEGTGNGVIRISNMDHVVLRWIEACMSTFGFQTIREGPNLNGVCVVRLRGGLRERLRFFHTVDPAIRRKLDIEGMALKSDTRTGVVGIEPLGTTMRLYDITTGTGDFIADGIVSHNCFARPTHTYLGFDAGRDFEREIVVKVNAPELVRAELGRPSWKGEHVAMGTNTDPYQWVE
ncbi:MAG TPA: hypothetical protein VMY78_18140, partial [Solirubrobacteraceae bacterium]|nr:hypothetical protein [Solirubrobacteraceae bacterium]